MDPFTAVPTLVLICNVKDPITGKAYTPRSALRGPEGRGVREEERASRTPSSSAPSSSSSSSTRSASTRATTTASTSSTPRRAPGTRGREGTPDRPNLGYKPRYKQGYFPVPPMDQFQDIRSDMVLALESVGVRVEVHHHEVATGGQTEIDMRFDTLTKMADKVCWYKYCAKNTAKKWGKTATFMPKPLFQDNGSGMHTHQSLWKNGKNLFYERGGYADISKTCLYYIGGILKHAPALLAFIAPEHQQLQAAGAGLRGADQPRVQPAQPLGGDPHPDVLEGRGRQAHRVPDARPDLQPVSLVRGVRDGRPRRRRQQDRPGQAGGQGPLRAARRRSRRRSSSCPARSTSCSTTSRRITTSCSRATCSRRT